jgi:hypothetical protein
MITKDELKELLYILNFYLLGSMVFGIIAATIVVNGGVLLVRSDYGLPFSLRTITVFIVILIGGTTGLLAYLVLLPAELRLIRLRNKPKLLAKRLARRDRNDRKQP